MPKYIIEREIPNAGALSAAELKAISQRSCSALQQLGPSIQWVQSFVTEDKITCVYIAPSADLIREHARLGGFPADRILEIATTIDPTTAESNEMAVTA
jgi:cell division inhibitor SulA